MSDGIVAEKVFYRNLEDGPPYTPVPAEIVQYFIEHYDGQMIPLNAKMANEIADILRSQGVDV